MRKRILARLLAPILFLLGAAAPAFADDVIVVPPKPIDRKFPAITWCQMQWMNSGGSPSFTTPAVPCTVFVDFTAALNGGAFGVVGITDVLVTKSMIDDPHCPPPCDSSFDLSGFKIHNWCHSSNGTPLVDEDFSSGWQDRGWILGPGTSVGPANGRQALRFLSGPGVPSAPCDTARARLALSGLEPNRTYRVAAWWTVDSPQPWNEFFRIGFSRPSICSGQPACSGSNCVTWPNIPNQCAVQWNGPGGDQWNTNSSPSTPNTKNPFNALWSAQSTEGQLHRASGNVLLDAGASSSPYVFGTTGWSENRTYRLSRTNGATTSWQSADTENDSGTGFRIAANADGTRIYHIDVGNRIRAYSTSANPAGTPLWSVDADAGARGIASMIKVAPDGRIFGHYNGTTGLNPSTGAVAWQSAGNPENAVVPGAFWSTGSQMRYVVSGTTNTVTAYNINAATNSGPVWSYVDSEPGWSGATVDPTSGAVYVFRSTRVIKLSSAGAFQWASPAVGAGEWGESYGALSRNGSTFYYQTAGPNCSGKLYAYDTSNGALRWVYPTHARGSIWYGGPIVSANNMVYVANGAEAPFDNRVFCLLDFGTSLTVLGTFDLNDHFDTGAPWLALDRTGVMYMDGWGVPDTPLLWAFKGQAQPVDAGPPAALDERLTVPNPLQPGALITFALPGEQSARVVVHDVLGRRVMSRSLVQQAADSDAPGVYGSFAWDGRADDGTTLRTGVYLVRILGEHASVSRKVVVVNGR